MCHDPGMTQQELRESHQREAGNVITFVVDFGGVTAPRVGRDTNILGGKLCAVQFDDALAELERAQEQRDELLAMLEIVLPDLDGSTYHLAREAIVKITRERQS